MSTYIYANLAILYGNKNICLIILRQRNTTSAKILWIVLLFFFIKCMEDFFILLQISKDEVKMPSHFMDF